MGTGDWVSGKEVKEKSQKKNGLIATHPYENQSGKVEVKKKKNTNRKNPPKKKPGVPKTQHTSIPVRGDRPLKKEGGGHGIGCNKSDEKPTHQRDQKGQREKEGRATRKREMERGRDEREEVRPENTPLTESKEKCERRAR